VPLCWDVVYDVSLLIGYNIGVLVGLQGSNPTFLLGLYVAILIGLHLLISLRDVRGLSHKYICVQGIKWVAHKIQGLYWVRYLIPYVQFEVDLCVFVCSVIGVLECKGIGYRSDVPFPPYIA